jgi:ABC-type amino acid transport substrate-binding protein
MPRVAEAIRARWPLLVAAALAVLALIVVMAGLWRTVSQPRDRFWERIQETGQWRVAMDPSFPPFEQLDYNGQPEGFDVDLARAIAARWGVQVQIESMGFDGLIDAVWASKVDSVISALPLQPQFGEDVRFSRPYFEAGLVVVVPGTDPSVSSLADLAGRRVAVEWGSEGDVQARALRRQMPDLQILALETAQATLQAVAAGEASAALVDRVTALAGLGGQLEILPSESSPEPLVLVSEPYVIVMPRRAPILHEQVDEALNALAADGTLEALTAKWFSSPPPAGSQVQVAQILHQVPALESRLHPLPGRGVEALAGS